MFYAAEDLKTRKRGVRHNAICSPCAFIRAHNMSKSYIHRPVCIKQSLLLMQYDEDPSRIS